MNTNTLSRNLILVSPELSNPADKLSSIPVPSVPRSPLAALPISASSKPPSSSSNQERTLLADNDTIDRQRTIMYTPDRVTMRRDNLICLVELDESFLDSAAVDLCK